MAIFNFFDFKLFELTSSISIMKMLVEQAENNVLVAVNAADEPGAVAEGEFDDWDYADDGESFLRPRAYYWLGPCVGYDLEEVKLEYKLLIAQLTRRSTYLTIFGVFEHRIGECLKLLIELTKCDSEIKGKGPIEKTQEVLRNIIGAREIPDVDHLTVIRNIMVHNDGNASDYQKILAKKDKKTGAEKRLIKSIGRTNGVQVNFFNGVIMDDGFLEYAVDEFNRYATSLEGAIQTYYKTNRKSFVQ